jgi:hypothetical protein
LLKNGSFSASFTPTVRRAAFSVRTPLTHKAHSVALKRRWVTVLIFRFNRRTISTSSRNAILSAVLLVLNLRRMIRRQARHGARTPFGEFGISTRDWASLHGARNLFEVPFTTTIAKVLNLSGSMFEAQTARTTAFGIC